MAKKRKKSSRKSKKIQIDTGPKHVLPGGFWRQVGALLLIAFAILLILGWFGFGGPVLDWIFSTVSGLLGYTVYLVPILFIYLAVEIFRAEENRLPIIMQFASVFILIWFSGLFGLLKKSDGTTTGGYIGDLLNQGVHMLVNGGVAAFIYILLIIITALFITRVSPLTIIKSLWSLTRRDKKEQEDNADIMHRAATLDASNKSDAEFTIKTAVPLSDDDTPKRAGGSLRNTLKSDPMAEEQTATLAVKDANWKFPSLELFDKKQSPPDAGDVKQNAEIIKDTLSQFNIKVTTEGADIGPRVTQYRLLPAPGVKLSKIEQYEDNIRAALKAVSLRTEAPIPGKNAVGIEVPNVKTADVRMYGMLTSPSWTNDHNPLKFTVGMDISGDPIVTSIADAPHLLIAGQTKAGKSVMLNSLLTSLLYSNSPSELRLILIDPKRVELAAFADVPHLLTPIIKEPEKAISALKWAVNEMERRYKLLEESRVKNIESYNRQIAEQSKKIEIEDENGNVQEHENGTMPYIVIVIDELANLMMMAARDVEALVANLTAKARAAGIHLVLATQRPTVNVVTGLIKANVPARLAFTVASRVDSMTILDQAGAEKLLGMGDMLIQTADMPEPKRVQGVFVSDSEINKLTDFLRMEAPPQYNDEVVAQPVQFNGRGGVVTDFDSNSDGRDDLFMEAANIAINQGEVSSSHLQRRLRVGFSRAARLVDELEEAGVIGSKDGNKPRKTLVSSLDEVFGAADEESPLE